MGFRLLFHIVCLFPHPTIFTWLFTPPSSTTTPTTFNTVFSFTFYTLYYIHHLCLYFWLHSQVYSQVFNILFIYSIFFQYLILISSLPLYYSTISLTFSLFIICLLFNNLLLCLYLFYIFFTLCFKNIVYNGICVQYVYYTTYI